MSHVVEFPGLGIKVSVNEVAFSIGNYDIRWYGVIIALGFALAVLYAVFNAKKMNIDLDKLFDAVIAGTIGGIVCARLYYVIFYPGDKYWQDPIQILRIHDGGIAIYGGIIGAMGLGSLVAKLRGLKVSAVLDLAALGFLIGQGIGRWGNFVNQECFGEPTSMPWGMISDNTRYMFPDSPVHPCFFYEFALCILGFVLLHFFNTRFRQYDGQTFILYIVWYGAIRFFIEGTRTDSLMIGPLRVSQVVAASCVVVGVVLLMIFRNRKSLSGCGNVHVMEAMVPGEASSTEPKTSTIFGDLPPFEDEKTEAGNAITESAGEAENEAGDAEVPENEDTPEDITPAVKLSETEPQPDEPEIKSEDKA